MPALISALLFLVVVLIMLISEAEVAAQVDIARLGAGVATAPVLGQRVPAAVAEVAVVAVVRSVIIDPAAASQYIVRPEGAEEALDC
jgi:hypothetical protein